MANPNLINVSSVLGANAGFNLTNTATATLITVASDKLVKINRISCANVDGTNAADVDLFVDGMGSGSTGVTTTGADATVYLAKTVTVPADTTLVLLDTPIYLMEGDVLKGGASANSDLDLFVSFEILDDA
jgi:predicted nucleotidyltransferase|tara:strand:- start:212 stop:604 length:393 start_codon:yes stop_codon:yes gene_type:complete